ncbi:septum formation family protein [Puerhibacterium sp. TATVAM-FAB25]|uniref:septum formation family protein n=1 Tax=Puerhibacterium sp. TATVAM-FAB25 TaxID=3093699 RepID=UPI00397CAE1B
MTSRQDSGEPEGPVFASPSPVGAVPDLSGVVLPGQDGARTAPGAAPSGLPHAGGAPAAPADADPAAQAAARRGRRRRALLVAGGVVAVALVGTGAALGAAQARERAWAPLEAALAAPRDANVVQLVLGSCVRDLPDGDLDRLTAVPCDEPHAAQVVGRTDAAADAVWPGAGALARRAAAVCGPQELGSAGRDADGVGFVVVTPTEGGWDAGDRTSLCLAVTAEPGTADLLE